MIYPETNKVIENLYCIQCLRKSLGGRNNTMSIFFNELLESVKQMDEVIKGQRVLSREHNIDAIQGNETRKVTDLGVGAVNATH